MKHASKRNRKEFIPRIGILKIYLLLYVFVKPQVFPPTSSQLRLYDLSSFSFPLLLQFLLSLSLRASIFRVIWTVASALRYVSFFVVLVWGNLRRCLPRPSFIKYRTLQNIYWTCWLFGLLAGNLGRSYCPCSWPIKTSRKLNIMR